jgi:arylsulfatase A
MIRRLLTIVLGLGAVAAPTGAAEAPRPNFVVIVIDDLGWADLGCYGSTFYETPNLDRLARRGVRFSQGYAACPVCSPTRAGLMTGRSPARLRLTDWLPGRTDRPSQKLLRPAIRQQLPLEEVTIAEALKPAGYVSASIGKWHLGGAGFWPEDQGFDVNLAGTQAGSPPGGYFGFKTPTLSAADPQEYLTDRLTDEAIGFLERNRDRPFFLYLPHYTVHIPLQAKKLLLEKYEAKGRSNPGATQANPVYAAMIESMDDGVGRIARKLEELGLDSRTTIVFTSDNGGLSTKEGPNTPATSNAPLRAGKGYLYEGGIRVPWIVAGPSVAEPGRASDAPIITTDLLPTILELADVPLPADREIDGNSFVPLLAQEGERRASPFFWHYPHYSNQGGRPGAAIRQGDRKLIEFYEDDRLELYDLAADPGEANDLASREPEEAQRLLRLLKEWRSQIGAQMPTPNPEYRPDPGLRKP